MKKIIPIFALIAIIGLVVFTLMPKYPTAPDFQLQDLSHQTVNNSNLANRVTLINFWFPSCPGCVSEMPKLIQMHHDYQGKDFQILAVAVPIDPLSSVQQYTIEHQLPFRVMFDADKNVTQSFVKTELFPTSVLINKRGQIVKTFVGEPDFSNLYQEVDDELTKL